MTDTQPIWMQLKALAVSRFGQSAEQLAPEDDLFETLGIDSLQALDLLTDLEDAFGSASHTITPWLRLCFIMVEVLFFP